MGPHSFKCGSLGGMGVIRIAEGGFNGAALFQVRKFVSLLDGQLDCRFCFNGAALFQVRKFGDPDAVALIARASMGPHSFKCGSATTLVAAENAGRASMGPHSFKCGSEAPRWQRR